MGKSLFDCQGQRSAMMALILCGQLNRPYDELLLLINRQHW